MQKKNEKELETLMQTMRIYSQNIEMKFNIEKCAILRMKSGKNKLQGEWNFLIRKESEPLERKKRLQLLGDIGSGQQQTRERN